MNLRPFVFATIGLYLSSLVLPAATCSGGGTLPGWVFLMMGWLGLIALDPRWLGNLLFVGMAIYCLCTQPARRSLSGAIGLSVWPIAAMAIGILSLTWQVSGCGDGAGSVSKVSALVVGAYVWVAALFSVSLLYLWRVWILLPAPRRTPRRW